MSVSIRSVVGLSAAFLCFYELWMAFGSSSVAFSQTPAYSTILWISGLVHCMMCMFILQFSLVFRTSAMPAWYKNVFTTTFCSVC